MLRVHTWLNIPDASNRHDQVEFACRDTVNHKQQRTK
jgi:hypothetical protein